jgi:hypothetical protein
MREFVNNAVQTVNLNNPILFDSSNCQCSNRGSKIYHDNGTGVLFFLEPTHVQCRQETNTR